MKMPRRAYKGVYQCLALCLRYKKCLPLNLQIRLLRVKIFFMVFNSFQKGDTKFRGMLKI